MHPSFLSIRHQYTLIENPVGFIPILHIHYNTYYGIYQAYGKKYPNPKE